MGAPSVPRTRSRTGCLTCRLRKVKCDESSYPVCSNCKHKDLPCSWPASKKAVYETLKEIKYIGGKEENTAGRITKEKGTGKPKKRNCSKIERQMKSQRHSSQRQTSITPYQNTPPNLTYRYGLYPDVSTHRRSFQLEPQLAATVAPTVSGAVSASVSAIWAAESKSSMLNKIALQEECVEEQVEFNDEKW